jgi:ribulose kinase
LLAVAVGVDSSPVSVSSNGDSRRDILVWMDHRAVDQAERISSYDSPVLQFYGGAVSPEMQAPKVTVFIFRHMILMTSWFIICKNF